jgi:hypothetical protein
MANDRRATVQPAIRALLPEMSFVGSKGAEGIAQWLICQMPFHKVYCEPFLGRGVVMKTKLPASLNIGIELDQRTLTEFWTDSPARPGQPALAIVHGNAFDILPRLKVSRDWLIYVDPPYLLQSRSCKRRYYRNELMTASEHELLLTMLQDLDANVMVSGYWSNLYAAKLATWTMTHQWTTTRRGKRVQEFCWRNFDCADRLHDVRFIGPDYTRRQGSKRKVERWRRKFEAMALPERQAILRALSAVNDCGRSL